MDPIGYTQEGIPQFTITQIDIWGYPHVDRYQVLETRDCVRYEADFHQEQSIIKPRPPHRYVRLDRFKNVLSQLMCQSLNVAKRVQRSDDWLDMLDEVGEIVEDHWFEARKILKKYGFETYYNRIPSILAQTSKHHKGGFAKKNYDKIVEDFKKMDKYFDRVREACGRKYFPNLRFTALMLMDHHKSTTHIDIPLAITKSKVEELRDSFDNLGFY
jgi:hypothetical protein